MHRFGRPKAVKLQHSLPVEQLSGATLQFGTKQVSDTNESQKLASKPAQSEWLAHGTPSPLRVGVAGSAVHGAVAEARA